MTTFNPKDRVWYRRHPHSSRLPAVVLKVCQLPGLYEVQLADVVVACTEQLSHRSENDRVEGLGRLRARMHREAAEQIRQDADLEPDELREKYDEVWGWGSHPAHTYEAWKELVADGQTRVGYWEWVSYELNR